MKAYMSFWTLNSDPKKQQRFLKILNIALFYAKQHHKEIHLITDDKGEQLLKNVFNWTSISTELESLPKEYGSVWSLGKIKSFNILSKKGDPFLHLDYDVFLIKPLPERILNADIFCQSFEYACGARYGVYKFNHYCQNKFYAENLYLNKAPNCGIIGGKDLDFFKKYSESSLELVLNEKNKDIWLGVHLNSSQKAVIAEQYYLAAIAKHFKKKIELLFEGRGYNTENSSKHFDTYVHLIGDIKNSEEIIKRVEYFNNFILK